MSNSTLKTTHYVDLKGFHGKYDKKGFYIVYANILWNFCRIIACLIYRAILYKYLSFQLFNLFNIISTISIISL